MAIISNSGILKGGIITTLLAIIGALVSSWAHSVETKLQSNTDGVVQLREAGARRDQLVMDMKDKIDTIDEKVDRLLERKVR